MQSIAHIEGFSHSDSGKYYVQKFFEPASAEIIDSVMFDAADSPDLKDTRYLHGEMSGLTIIKGSGDSPALKYFSFL